MHTSDQTIAQRWFWVILSLHILLWTLVPTLTRHALPMDAAEGAVWGQHLQLGYDRNAWVNAWLTRLAVELGGSCDFFIYLFSQLCVGLGFWSLWRLARTMLSPYAAVVAVLMLEAVQYYSLAAVDFNDNVLELGLWPCLILVFYRAVTAQRKWDWLGVGVLAGLAVMTKYYALLLLLALLVFLLSDPRARRSFNSRGFYLSIGVFLGVVFPHCIWLWQHDALTIKYALLRVQDNNQHSGWHYIQPAVKFAAMQLIAFAGAVVLLAALWGKQPRAQSTAISTLDRFNRRFLWIVGVGPYALTVLLALVAGWQLHTLWGMPLLGCWGILLLAYLKPSINRAQFQRFVGAVLLVCAVLLGGYTRMMLQPGNTASGNFPAMAFAGQITATWHHYYPQPLAYVVGDRVFASYVARYSPDKPSAHLNWDAATNPWIDPVALRRAGAIFLQNATAGTTFPSQVLANFPGLKTLGVQYIAYAHPAADSKPISVLVGVLAPQDQSK